MKIVKCKYWYNQMLVNWFPGSFACETVPPAPTPVPTPNPLPVPVPTPTPTPSSGTWPAYRCDKFMQHGVDEENEVREAAMDAAQKAGLDCIRCNVGKMNDELAVHLLHFRSPVDGDFKLGKNNWYTKGLTHGIKRYQFVVTPEYAGRWAKLVVDYPPNSVQFMAENVAAVSNIIKDRPVVQKVD